MKRKNRVDRRRSVKIPEAHAWSDFFPEVARLLCGISEVRMSPRFAIPFRLPFLHQSILGVSDMRIISRSVNEGLVIDDNVRMTVLEIQHNYIRLGIETPHQAPYYREEKVFFGDGDGGRVAPTKQLEAADEPVVPAVAL